METMRNFIENKGGKKWLVFESNDGTAVDTTALGMLENNDIEGMLPFTAVRFNSTVTARYDVTDMITLTELLEGTVTREMIMKITETYLNVIEETENYLINPGSVLTDTDCMFYDTEKERLCICVNPFISDNNSQALPEAFLKDFICRVKFDSTENCDYIGKMLGFLNSGAEFSISEFRKLILSQKISDNVSLRKNEITEEKVYESSVEASSAESGNNVSGGRSSENIHCENSDLLSSLGCYADEIPPAEEESRKGILAKFFGDGIRRNRNKSVRDSAYEDSPAAHFCDENGEIIIPDNDSMETVVLKKSHSPERAVLVRENGNEKIEITSGRFRIGADKNSVDYCISDNCAVSRIHAEIIRKNGGYFIMDNNSTNHTFVDSRKIRSRREVKITDNSRITLADEEFLFRVNA